LKSRKIEEEELEEELDDSKDEDDLENSTIDHEDNTMEKFEERMDLSNLQKTSLQNPQKKILKKIPL
jgi:hypothetical protein